MSAKEGTPIENGLTSGNLSPITTLEKVRRFMREFLAELIGTCLLVLFGDGVIAQVTFNRASVGSSFLSINIGWALGITCAIMVAGPVSGGHLNPAVTIASALFSGFPLRKVPVYIMAQMLGAFLGALLVFLIYLPAFDDFDGGIRATVGEFATAGIFATYPYVGANHFNSFIEETILTAVFLLGIKATTDPRRKIPFYMVAIIIGGIIGAIGISIGLMSGYALNPARDLGPRLFTSLAGWGAKPFIESNYYFWIPIFAPIVGACLGVGIYDYMIDPPME